MEDFRTEIVRIHPENPYIKVYVSVIANMTTLQAFVNSLSVVNHANITLNQAGTRESLTVYPMKTCSVEEAEQEINRALSNYFRKVE